MAGGNSRPIAATALTSVVRHADISTGPGVLPALLMSSLRRIVVFDATLSATSVAKSTPRGVEHSKFRTIAISTLITELVVLVGADQWG